MFARPFLAAVFAVAVATLTAACGDELPDCAAAVDHAMEACGLDAEQRERWIDRCHAEADDTEVACVQRIDADTCDTLNACFD